MKNQKGFTLVEILIVVVILGILAAIVIPQFTQAGNEARESSLVSNLQAVRAQIELYKIQHLDVLPTAAGLEDALTTITALDGTLWVSVQADGQPFGPYMSKVPVNPFTNKRVISASVGTADWLYIVNGVTNTYTFQADDGGMSPDGKLHIDL